MLVLTRKLGEEVIIGDNIRLTVVSIRGNQVRLGFTAPAAISIQRKELCDKAEDLGDLGRASGNLGGRTIAGQIAATLKSPKVWVSRIKRKMASRLWPRFIRW